MKKELDKSMETIKNNANSLPLLEYHEYLTDLIEELQILLDAAKQDLLKEGYIKK